MVQQHREEHRIGTVEHRKWGHFEIMDLGERYKVKKMVVEPQGAISLQFHDHRTEHWVMVEGGLRVYANEMWQDLKMGQTLTIRAKEWHRALNTSGDQAVFVEVQVGDYLGEDDIVRYDEKYGRNAIPQGDHDERQKV